jgi:serine/threonine protein phosphatase 1
MIYAIGDIHGQLAQLIHALTLIEADGGPDAEIVFLGDYTDRGPDSRGVIEVLTAGLAHGRAWTAIKGNHDRMFERFVTDGNQFDDRILSGRGWLDPALGGDKTLTSYGVDPSGRDVLNESRTAVPPAHLAFLRALPHWHRVGDLLFVHAGILPGVAMADQAEDDLLWIRGEFLTDMRDHGPLIVHGHTALDNPTAYRNRINLDGGAGYGRPLVPAVFEGRDCWLLTGQGRVPLRVS